MTRFLTALAFALLATGMPQTAPPVIRTESRMVVVDTVVTDRKGVCQYARQELAETDLPRPTSKKRRGEARRVCRQSRP